MNITKLRLVTFDITDTLLKFSQSPGKVYSQVGALYGIICDHNLLSINFKNHFRRMNIEHPNFGLHSGLGWKNWWKSVILNTFKDCKQDIDEEKLNRVALHLIEEYTNKNCWQINRGALDLLSYLRHRGLILGVISNFDPRLARTLENIKLSHYFQFILTSYDVGAEKPHPKIFQEAIIVSHLKNLQSKECLHIGDSISLDYVGAVNAGWNGAIIMKQDKGIYSNTYNINVNHMFNSLYDLHKHIMNVNSQSLITKFDK